MENKDLDEGVAILVEALEYIAKSYPETDEGDALAAAAREALIQYRADTGQPEGYVVTRNNPYYPAVKYVSTLLDAYAQRDEWLAEVVTPDPRVEGYAACITIARVVENTSFATAF